MFRTKMSLLDLMLIFAVWTGILPFLATLYAKYAMLALAFYQAVILMYLLYDKINFSKSPRRR